MTKKIIVFLFAILGIHLVIQFSGYDYLYTVVRMTLLKGQLSPAIDEYPAFSNDTVRAGEELTFDWPRGSGYNKRELPDELHKKHEALRTVAYLVIRDDSVRYEMYREGFDEAARSNSFSMAKSIVGVLVGTALKEGAIDSLDQPVCAFLPEYCEGKNAELTVKHLLTMSPGINFRESYLNPFAYPAKANYGSDLKALNSEYRITEEPGKVFSYQSGTSQLLAFVLQAAVDMPLAKYAEEKLWKPLGARHDALWSKDREDGDVKAFCCFNSNARDFALIGRLYLHHGFMNGRRIVDSAYVAESVQPADYLTETNGEPNERFGYQWWTEKNYKGLFDFFYMRGLKGQYVIVIPDLDMIVVRLGRHREKRGAYDLPKDVEYWIDGALEVSE